MMTVNNAEQKSSAEYEGELDENKMRNGHGEETYKRKHGNEYYAGSFTKDAYNGLGFYKNDSIFGPKWTYEGSFLSNAKEGYGLLSLPDNTYFEGLYQSDRPFGPGVLTRMNGDQDVGFWLSSSIIRLIREVPCEINEFSTTPENISYIARFKKLVEIAPPKSIAKQVTVSLHMPDEVAPQLYSIYCKDPKNFLFNYEAFEQLYFEDLKKMGDLVPLLSMEDFSQLSLEEAEETTLQEETIINEMFEPYGEVTLNENTETGNIERTYIENDAPLQWERLRKRVNLLLAWNNSPLLVEIMAHTFINRIYEKMAGFDVTSFLCCRRQKFEPQGPLEWACVQLLKSSNDGDVRDFTWFLFSNNLNINVQDSKGNGCVIRAAAGDHHALVYLMFLYGADMNTTNDEGFTALNHTLTRYLALIHNVKSWGSAFLPQTRTAAAEVKARIWRKCSETTVETRKSSSKSTKTKKSFRQSKKSTKSIKSTVTSQPATKASAVRGSGDEPPRYIFDLQPAKKIARHRMMLAVKRPMKKMSISEVKDSIEETERQNRISDVCKTLALLISLKINMNVSNVPQPSIILALFSGDVELVKMLLEAGADPNARMLFEEGWLTPLHILCLAKPQPSFPEIMDLLLENGADPNARAAIDFSPENTEFVLNGQREEEFTVVGVTPLQALLLRSDSTFVEGKEVFKELLLRLHDITSKDPNYFGHSFLSLAVIRMNLAFIFALLHIFSEDPNENLDVHWGNIATAYLMYLGRVKEPESIIALIELEQAGMNPLRIVDTLNENNYEENAINFGLRLMKGTSVIGKGKSVNDHKDGNQSTGSHDVEKKKSGTTMSHISAGSGKSGGSHGKTAKVKVSRELLKKVTLFQDLGREKVDQYVRGVVIRRLVKYLRGKEYQGQHVEITDDPIKQALNWFGTEEDFVQVLMHNVLAGHTFVSKEDVQNVYNTMPWEHAKNPPAVVTMKKMTAQRDSLGQKDKVLLRQLKEAIKIHLQSGMPPEKICFAKKRAPGSKRSRSKSPSARSKGNHDEQFIPPISNNVENHEPYEGRATTIDELTHEQNLATFLKKVEPLLIMCAPQVRWAKRYGAKTVRLPKRQTYRTDFFPEVDKNPFLYHVCYKCVKRDPALQLCPVCKLIWYCSSRCNIRDLMNPNSNHRCKADFYGRCEMWRQYDFDEEGNILRKPRKGNVEWEADDILNDSLLKKHGKKSQSPEGAVSHGKRGTSDKGDHGQGFGRQAGSRHDARHSKGRSIGSGERGRGREKGSNHSAKGGRGGRDSFDSQGKLKYRVGPDGEKYQVGPDGKYRRGTDGKYRAGTDGKYKYGPDGKLIGKPTGAKGIRKARLQEKRELKMKEARRLRELRKKLPKGVMGDFMRWGLMTMQDLKEKPWYQSQGTLGSISREPPGETGSPDAYNRLKSQLLMMEDLARILGTKLDLHNLFPWVVLRDGELYYKFQSTLFVLENYSFN